MVTLPLPPRDDDDFDAPTLKRSIPAELEYVSEEADPVTTKLRATEIAALLETERQRSGVRPAVSEEEIERFARREIRETLPAPPEPPLLIEVANLDADDGR